MRIGVNCFLLQAHIGGLKQYFLNLFDWLLENDSKNEYVFFHFPHNLGELAKLQSRRWENSSFLLSNQSEIRPEKRGVDVYFCPLSALWPRPVSIPSVVTLVDIQEVFFPKFFSAVDLYNRAYHYPSSTRAADRVITISEYSKSTIVEHHGIEADKVIVAHLCAHPLYLEAPAIAKAPDAAVPFRQFLFFPANRWHHKNHDVLLRAVRSLNEAGEPTNAVFTGLDVEGGYPLFEMAGQYGVLEHVHTAGYVTVPQMAHLYTHAEMLVFPSLFEGFGMPPVEAMAAGCPAVVASSTCLPEICRDAAEYFDPLNVESLIAAIRNVRNDSTHRRRLVEKGHGRAKLFSPEALGNAHLRAFDEATQAYSRMRYRWFKYVREPYHRLRVGGQYLLQQRRKRTGQDLCRIVFSNGWHAREQQGSTWVRWSKGDGKILIEAPTDFTMAIKGEAASAQRQNRVKLRINGRLEADWEADRAFEFFELSRVELELKRGRNTVEFASELRGIPGGNGDGRTLALAVRNLSFEDVQRRLTFSVEN